MAWKQGGARNAGMVLFKAAMYRYLGFHGPIMDRWGDCVVWVDLHGKFAYLGVTTRLVIVDADSGPDMRFVSQLSVGGVVHGMERNKGYLYLASGDAGLVVVDVTNPVRPRKVISFPTMGYTFGVTRHGNTLYVADRNAGVRIFDISRAGRPRLIGRFNDLQHANAVAVRGQTVFVADGRQGLVAFDVSDPGKVRLIGQIAIKQPPRDFPPIDPPPLAVHIKGRYLFAAAGDAGLAVVDISRPEAMRISAILQIPGSATDLRLSGDTVYMAQREGGLCIVDIKNPENPRIVRTIPTDGTATSVSVSGKRIVVGEAGRGASLHGISDSFNPRPMARYKSPSAIRAVAAAPGLLVAASGSAGLAVYDVSSPARPGLAAVLPLPDQALDVFIKGKLAYVAMGHSGLAVVDLSEPESPRLLAVRKTPEYALSVTGFDDSAATAEGVTGYSIFDVAKPHMPRFVHAGHADEQSGYTFFVKAFPQGLLVANYTGGAGLFNNAKPAHMERTATKGPRRVLGATMSKGELIFLDYKARLITASIRPDQTFHTYHSLHLKGHQSALDAQAGTAVALSYDSGLRIIDISNPGKTHILGHLDLKYPLLDAAIQNKLIYVAAGRRGIAVIDISSKAKPKLVRLIPAPSEN
jgi:hypothetical protein